MKPNNLDKAAAFSARWKQILLVVLLGLYAACMEWKSYGNWDFSELVWLGAVLILSLIVGSAYLTREGLSPGMWVGFGTLCWSFWRFLGWIFASRAGWIIGFIAFLTLPLRNIMRMDVVELAMLVLTILLMLLSIWGTYWVYKHFDLRWLRKGTIYWGILLAVVIIVAVYSGQQHYKDNCFGVNAFSESLSCKLRDNLGVIGSVWVTLTFLSWALTLALREAKSNSVLAMLWIVALEPVWIAIFFNPTRILGGVLFKLIRASGDNILIQTLVANMKILNLLPIAAFFLLIPIGLLLVKSMKTHVWWTVSASAITFAIMLYVLFQTLALNTLKSVSPYTTTDHAMFVFMALQLWLPLVIISIMGRNIEVSSMSDNRQ